MTAGRKKAKEYGLYYFTWSISGIEDLSRRHRDRNIAIAILLYLEHVIGVSGDIVLVSFLERMGLHEGDHID